MAPLYTLQYLGVLRKEYPEVLALAARYMKEGERYKDLAVIRAASTLGVHFVGESCIPGLASLL